METEGHVRDLLSASGRNDIDAFVALDPEAAFALCEAGRSYLKLEDGYAETDVRIVAVQALDDQQRWAEWLDRSLQERVPAFRRDAFSPAQLYLYWLKILLDSLSVRAHTVDWALRRWKPRRLLYAGPEQTNASFGWDLMYHESLYPTVLRQAAGRLGIDAALPDKTPAADARGVADGPAWWTGGSLLFRRRAVLTRTLRARLRTLWSGGSLSGRDSLIVSDGYDLRALWQEGANEGVPLTAWEAVVDSFRRNVNGDAVQEARPWMADAWDSLSACPEFRCVARPAGFDFWPMVEPRLRFWWNVLVPQQWAVYQAARRGLARQPPRAVAAAVISDHVERAVFSALRSLGVPAFIHQHGGFVGCCECLPWDCADLWLAEYELTYGAGVTAYFDARRERYQGHRARPISIGSSRLDALRRQFEYERLPPAARPTVLLVPNLIPGNNRYLDGGSLPDVTEAEVQASMVAIAGEFPDYDFVFKPFPFQIDTPATRIASRAGSNCRVELRAGLTRLLPEASFIVLNFPSTALLEALLTDRPIIVFADRRSIRMFPEAKAALSRRAMLAETVDDFLAGIRSVLERKAFAPVPNPDQTFLRMYGTHLNDGASARRALDAIKHGHIAH